MTQKDVITHEDIVRRIIMRNGCHDISCSGKRLNCHNEGVECPFFTVCTGWKNGTLHAKAWMNEHRQLPCCSTFTVWHRFKPGDRVQHKYDAAGAFITVAEVIFTADCGAFYRFAEDGVPTGSISYCDENLRLADCEEEAEKAKEMP